MFERLYERMHRKQSSSCVECSRDCMRGCTGNSLAVVSRVREIVWTDAQETV
jgi:hypothetical protein